MSKSKIAWATKTGQQILLCDLTDAHLLNIIHMIRRKAIAAREKGCGYLLAGDYEWESLNRERRRRGLCGIHTGDCIYASNSDNDDRSFFSRACYAKQLEERKKMRKKIPAREIIARLLALDGSR